MAFFRACPVMLPALVLFFSARSFGRYFVTPFLVGTVAAFTTRGAPEGLRARPRRKLIVGGSSVLVAASLVWVLLSRPPPGVHISSVATTGQLGTNQSGTGRTAGLLGGERWHD